METQSAGNLPPQKITVHVSTNPFGFEHERHIFDEGVTIEKILSSVNIKPACYPIVLLGDQEVYPDLYDRVKPKIGSIISVAMVPMGGGFNPIKAVVSIAAAVFAPYIAAPLAASLGVTSAIGLAATKAVVGFALNAVGSLLVNAIAPPAKPKLAPISGRNGISSRSNIQKESQTYFIEGARNREIQGGVIPVLLGRHRFVPPLAARNYTEASGDKVYSRQLFCLGYGTMNISEEQIGETALSSYQGVDEQEILDGNSTGALSLYPESVAQNDLNVSLTSEAGWVQQTTALDTDEFEVQIVWPNGLLRFDDQNNKQSQSVSYEIRYAPTGTTNWVTSSFSASASQTKALIKTHQFDVTRGQYDVQIRRTTSDSTDVQIRDEFTWSALRSFKNENPVNKDGLCLKALRILGSNQLNGAVDQYNAIGEQTDVLDWNGSTWAKGFTNNPASIYRYVMQGDPAKTQITDSEIDLTTLQEWHDFCAEKELTYNAYIDYETDRETLLREIAAAGMASPTIIDNKYSVVIDQEKTDIVQAITPRNSSGYVFERVFQEIPHAFKVTLLNEDKNYLQDSIVVYDDGYSVDGSEPGTVTATQFEEIDFPGVTSTAASHKLARHHLATLRLRPVVHTVTMDIENIRFTKGDRVKFAHDVPLLGLGYARVKSVQDDGVNITGITVDDEFTIEASTSYGVRIRRKDGTQITRQLSNSVAGSTDTLTFTTPEVIANGPEIGDLVIFGENGEESIDCLVQAIEPIDDFSANIKLVDYAPGVFTASEGPIPDYDNQITLPPEFRRPSFPVLISTIVDEAAQVVNMDGSISNRMIINLQNINGFPVEPLVDIRRVEDDEFQVADTVLKEEGKVVIENLVQGASYDINIRYRRLTGSLLSNNVSFPLQIRGLQFTGTSNPPPDVTGFNLVVRGEGVFLEWDSVNAIDLDHYEVRFSSTTVGATWGNAVIVDNAIPKGVNTLAVPSAIGTYLIRAVDRQGNKSENATLAVTSIGLLLNLNVEKTIPESTNNWPGSFEGTLNDSGSLKLGGTELIDDYPLIDTVADFDFGEGGIASGGIYYFQDTEDLGEILDVVLRYDITIGGENVFDEIDEWTDIDSRTNWDGAEVDQYEVELQVRTTNDDPNATPVWSDWRRFIIGEYTARAFEFRVVLTSNVADITPVVSNLSVTIDVPDRDERGENLTSGTGGYAVTYTFPFRESPAVVVTGNDMQTGDYGVITNQSVSGFTVEFFDSADTSISRNFSWYAKGYGRVT